MKKYIFVTSILFLCLFSVFAYQKIKFDDGKLHLIVCDVGQGDGIFIRTPGGSDILVDGGPDDSILKCLSDHMPFWDRTIEAVILTHPDADHITGVVDVIERYRVDHLFTQATPGTTLIYKRFLETVKNKEIVLQYVSTGDQITMKDGTNLDILWPSSKESQQETKLNELSVIAVLNYGNFKSLLTADAGVAVEEQIAPLIGKIDVLKVPHHGSKTGMSSYFLSEIQPSIAIISVGAKNKYGHPTREMLDLLTNQNIKTFRTDQDGEVEVVSDGKSFAIK